MTIHSFFGFACLPPSIAPPAAGVLTLHVQDASLLDAPAVTLCRHVDHVGPASFIVRRDRSCLTFRFAGDIDAGAKRGRDEHESVDGDEIRPAEVGSGNRERWDIVLSATLQLSGDDRLRPGDYATTQSIQSICGTTLSSMNSNWIASDEGLRPQAGREQGRTARANETQNATDEADPEGNQVSSETGQGFVRGIAALGRFKLRQIEYAVVDGRAVFEGCIELGSVADMEEISARVKKLGGVEQAAKVEDFGIHRGWEEGIVPFEIEAGLPDKDRVTGAIAIWQAKTDIRFRKAVAADANVLVFKRSSAGCSANCGRIGGRQSVNLGDRCTLGSTIHEIGHALGLWHEQSREDRDQFVKIHLENVSEENRHNFTQHIMDGDDLGGYDFDSIMHYSAKAFSVNGKPTIVARNGAAIGQREGPSAGDVRSIQTAYKREFAKRTS